MTLIEIVDKLDQRLRDSVLVDPELRKRVIAEYEEGTLDGIPADAIIRIEWQRPRSAERLRKDLNRLDRIGQERWGTPLPRDFRQVYESYGRLRVTIRWDADGEEDGAGCEWDWPATSLASSWVTEPAWEETHPDGSHHTVFHPVIPFMQAESSEPVALVFAHVNPVEIPSVERIYPECFSRSEGGLLYADGRPGGFTDWFARWIDEGLSNTG